MLIKICLLLRLSTFSLYSLPKLTPLSKMCNQATPLHSLNPQLLSILQILLEPQIFQCSDHLCVLIPPLPFIYTHNKTHSSILGCEAMCCTTINCSDQEHHRNNKKTESWGDPPSAHLCEKPHFPAACPSCQLRQEAAALCRWICSPGTLEQPFECHRALGGSAEPRVGDGQAPPRS